MFLHNEVRANEIVHWDQIEIWCALQKSLGKTTHIKQKGKLSETIAIAVNKKTLESITTKFSISNISIKTLSDSEA